jgi:hypothetical protein
VAWSWRYEATDGTEVESGYTPRPEVFPSQGDAETWLGENWQELLHAGVAQVTLLNGAQEVYGPMSLSKDE